MEDKLLAILLETLNYKIEKIMTKTNISYEEAKAIVLDDYAEYMGLSRWQTTL